MKRLIVLAFCSALCLLSCQKQSDRSQWVVGGNDKPAPGTDESGLYNLSAGKFYKFSASCAESLKDHYPVDPWSSGIKLTDEEISETKGSATVGWTDSRVEVIVDLGSQRTISKVNAHVLKDNSFPSSVDILTTNDISSIWTPSGKKITFRSDAADAWGEVTFPDTRCRYVKFVFNAGEGQKVLMVDEISVYGKYVNDPKYVPSNGAYHGAFNNSTSFADNKDPNIVVKHSKCPVDTYEAVTGKKLSMMLWYQNMSPFVDGVSRDRPFSEMEDVRTGYYGLDYGGKYRFFIYGWLPLISSADQVRGVLDEYHKKYFQDVSASSVKDKGPIWFRPANEMNGNWLPYYGDPVNYVRAWRRMYNIAEQCGVTAYNVFVWSPNAFDSPASGVNKMASYYPGDIYVDWIGCSLYPPGKSGRFSENDRYPATRIKEVLKISAEKPCMVTEGAYSSDYGQSEANKKIASNYASDHLRWVREWFALKDTEPRVKALIWENHVSESAGDRRIHTDAEALKLYKELVADEYWLGEIPEDVWKEVERRKNQ